MGTGADLIVVSEYIMLTVLEIKFHKILSINKLEDKMAQQTGMGTLKTFLLHKSIHLARGVQF